MYFCFVHSFYGKYCTVSLTAVYGNFCILGMLKYGAGSRHATSQPLHDLCRDLHCHRDRYTWTSHPALEGTACGTNKVYSLFNHSSYTVINNLWEFREKNKVKNIDFDHPKRKTVV